MLGNRENVAVVQNNVERKFRNSILCTTPQSLAGVHCSSACSNGANIGERKTRTQSEFCTWQNSVRGKSPKMCTQCTSPWDGQTSAKFGWPPSVQWRSEDAKPVEFVGGVNRSQTLVGRSSPYSEDTFRRYCCSTSFFLIVYTCLSCEHTARQSYATVRRWPTFASCISASRVQH